jgi:chorismate mutase
MKNNPIEKLRKKVDIVDGKLVNLLVERFKVTEEILSIKKKNGFGAKDRVREETILEDVAKLAKEFKIDPGVVVNIFKSILKESKK